VPSVLSSNEQADAGAYDLREAQFIREKD
jgi:hypothetical protein